MSSQGLELLSLEISSHFKGFNASTFKWGAKFTTKNHGVTLLYAKSLSKMKEAEEEDDEIESVITRRRLIRRVKLARECITYAGLWLVALSCVVTRNPTLQSVTITDPKDKGVKVCLCGEKLAEFRTAFNWDRVRPLAEEWMLEVLKNMRVGYVPVLQLPVSRYVMKEVIMVNFVPNGDDDSESESAMLDSFVEEQGVFSEAVGQILKHHKDSIKAFDFYDLIDA